MKAWANTVENYQHVNFGHPVVLKANKDSIVSGDGSSGNAFLSKLVTGQCTGVSLAALQKVGFLDTRFKGFGGAHVEWSYRFNKMYPVTLNEQKNPQLFATYRGGLIENDAPTFRDEEQVAKNRKLRKKLANDSVLKKPWRNIFEKLEFLLEQSKA
jgi:hypothetical protein